MAKSIMIQGTSSGAGKTILTMALCRIFKQDGYSVAPFKSQNVTSNTALTKNGDEIAVSQLLQAQAAGTEPTADVNPVILKYGQAGTEVILNGRHYADINAQNYKDIKQTLIPEILAAHSRLAGEYDIIVIEGAGSPVELNLNNNDIVNMGIATRVKAPVLLVSDIDRGGVFASLYGTIKLFSDVERSHVKATIVNRFKGEVAYFKDGVEILEEITGVPVAGVVPYISFDIPEEDIPYKPDSLPYEPGRDLECQYDLIADNVRSSVNMDLVYRILNSGV